jgi:hypothetical protein
VAARSQVHHELCALLSPGEQLELRVSEHFVPFALLPAFAASDFNKPRWEAALAEYEQQMAPVEQRIAEKLKEKVRRRPARFVPQAPPSCSPDTHRMHIYTPDLTGRGVCACGWLGTLA